MGQMKAAHQSIAASAGGMWKTAHDQGKLRQEHTQVEEEPIEEHWQEEEHTNSSIALRAQLEMLMASLEHQAAHRDSFYDSQMRLAKERRLFREQIESVISE